MSNPDDNRPTLLLGHSPDPDDAFMWFPMTGIDGGPPLIETGRFRYRSVADDIESLNRRAGEVGDLDITAISIAQYPFVADRYILTDCGASMGDGYGPKVVVRGDWDLTEQSQIERWRCVFDRLGAGDRPISIAMPGERTSAYLTIRMMTAGVDSDQVRYEAVPFDEIMDQVESGRFDVGVVIHEGQLTCEQQGLAAVCDLGRWWFETEGLPLPLGGNAIWRDLEYRFGPGTLAEITDTLQRSIRYALDHREQAIAYAQQFGRGLSYEQANEFVAMYVNDFTLEFGERGRRAVEVFLSKAAEAGLCPAIDVGSWVC